MGNSGPIECEFCSYIIITALQESGSKMSKLGAEPSFELELYVENPHLLVQVPHLNPLLCEF